LVTFVAELGSVHDWLASAAALWWILELEAN